TSHCMFATMTMEGKILVFKYKDFDKSWTNKGFSPKKTRARIEIRFTEEIWIESYKYIGNIQLYENNEGYEIDIIVNIELRNYMFEYLRGMQKKGIRVETSHDLLDEPIDNIDGDNIVALVKRVDFETEFAIPNKKEWPFILQRKRY